MIKQRKKRLETRFGTVAILAVFLLFYTSRAAFAIDTWFMPFDSLRYPPSISDITNTSPEAGSTMKVYATIEGMPQKRICQGENCDRYNCLWMQRYFFLDDLSTNCEWAGWYLTPDPDSIPNPPCIPNPNGTGSCHSNDNPKLYYRINDDFAGTQSVIMSYNSNIGKFEGTINLAEISSGDTLTYFISAVDSMGNVVSQIPQQGSTPCSSLTSWNADYATPSTNNCATASNYEVCYENRTGHPTCGADYTINDPIGDTCGEPDDHGIKNVMTGWDIVDIHGFSVGVGKGYDMLPNEDVICADIKLGAKPPYLGSGAVESYMMFFFNPDIPDPNPDDIHFTNSFAVVYTPKICGTDSCQLSQILMDGNCSTNPNNPNPGSCRIFEYYGNEQRLKIGDSSNELKLVVKNNLPNGKSIIGPTNNNAIMFFSTMKIQLSGGTPFSSVDLTPSVRIVNYNQSVSATLSNPAPPILRSNTCQSNGVGTISTCIKQGTTIPAAGNVCVFDILPSPDRSFTNYYNVYYNTVDDRNTATLVETLSGPDNFPENLSSLYTKRFNISNVELDGSPRYFYFSSVNSSAEPELRETPVANWSKAVCFPEDWQAPEPPDDFTCATPQGSDGVCLCEWTADRVSDPSIYGFDIARNNVIQNVSAILTDYFSQSGLTNIAQYSYKIRTMDVGDNKSSWRLAECVPEDRTPPGKIEPSIIAPQGWDNVSVMWNSRNEQDIAGGGGYNVYYCERDNPDACGADSEGMPVGYAKLNVELIPHPDTPGLMSYLVDPSIEFLGNEWCFWVEACDNCKAAGTCPSGDGSNCSRFDEMYRHRICLRGDETPEDNTPLWPENQKATAEPQGQSCRIEWEQVCQGELGEFGNCSFPAQSELTGYKIMRAPAVDGGCGNLPDPSAGVPLSIAPASGPTSYTDSGPHLENGVAYCYRVYAYNMYDRYSRETPAPASSGPVVCVPQDITPPEKPQMNAPLEFDGFSCLPAWSAVADKNPVTYDVHRCEGIWPTCNSAAKFSKINASPMTDLNYIDESVTTETQYVYCVTAMDPIGNASSVYTASDISNCGYCLPSDKCLPPTAVEAFEIAPTYYGARAGWTNSANDDGMGAGYHVYLCANSNPESCLTPYGRLTASPAPGAHDRQLGQEPLSFYSIPVAVSGDYYLGVSYTGVSCGESMIAVSPSPVRLETQDPCAIDPDACPVSIGFGKPFTKYEIETCAAGAEGCLAAAGAATGFKKVETPLPGVRVEVVDAATKMVVKSSQTDMSGNIPIFRMRTGICSECVGASGQYIIRAVFPEGTWDPGMSEMMGCAADSAPGECAVTLKAAGSLSATTDTTVSPTSIPVGNSGGGGEIGNPTCRPTVHMANLQPLKYRFGAIAGDSLYHPAADFNMDGKVSMQDLDVFKKNYGKSVPVSANTLLCDPLYDAR